jgi:hypothetical protein
VALNWRYGVGKTRKFLDSRNIGVWENLLQTMSVYIVTRIYGIVCSNL